MGRVDEAIAAFEVLLAAQVRVLGVDHPDTLLTRTNFGYLLADWLEKAGHVMRL